MLRCQVIIAVTTTCDIKGLSTRIFSRVNDFREWYATTGNVSISDILNCSLLSHMLRIRTDSVGPTLDFQQNLVGLSRVLHSLGIRQDLECESLLGERRQNCIERNH